MSISISLLLLAAAVILASPDPFQRGEFATAAVEYRQIANLQLDHNLRVFAPNATGNFPVLYYSTGVAGTVTPLAYELVLDRVASHGVAVLAPHHLANPADEYEADWLDRVDEWARKNLRDKLIEDGIHRHCSVALKS